MTYVSISVSESSDKHGYILSGLLGTDHSSSDLLPLLVGGFTGELDWTGGDGGSTGTDGGGGGGGTSPYLLLRTSCYNKYLI